MDSQWHICKEGKTEGPVSWERLRQQAECGELQPEDLVWKSAYKDWIEASKVEGLFTSPPPPPIAKSGGVPGPVMKDDIASVASTLSTPDKKKTPRPIRRMVLSTLLGFCLLVVAIGIYSGCCYYRDMNDNSLMDEIRTELGKDADIHSVSENSSEAVTASASDERMQMKKQLMKHPLIAFLGMKEAEIKNRYGEPEEIGNWKGAQYYSYSTQHDMLFFFAEDLPGVVIGISYFGTEEILGTRVGMTMDEIKSILGNADNEGFDNDYTPPEYSYYYKFTGLNILANSGRKDLELVFYTSSPQDPINYVDIFCK